MPVRDTRLNGPAEQTDVIRWGVMYSDHLRDQPNRPTQQTWKLRPTPPEYGLTPDLTTADAYGERETTDGNSADTYREVMEPNYASPGRSNVFNNAKFASVGGGGARGF